MPHTDLTEEIVHATLVQLQSFKDAVLCLVEVGYNSVVVALCDGVFWIVECVHQGQDVAGYKKKKRAPQGKRDPSEFQSECSLAVRNSPVHACVEFLRGPEADDGVDDCCGVH